MRPKFGFLSKLDFLQNITSSLLSGLNPAIVHNLEKYLALKKVHYLSAIEEIEGDYIEFGVYTGSSFCHSIRCVKKLMKVNKNLSSTRFFGFDSFEGFGELSDDDFHPFYKDSNFETSYEKVDKRVKKVSKNFASKIINYQLIFWGDRYTLITSNVPGKNGFVSIMIRRISPNHSGFGYKITNHKSGMYLFREVCTTYSGRLKDVNLYRPR